MVSLHDDYLDLTFQSMAKRINDNLTPDQRDDLVDEMFLLVSEHIREPTKYPPGTSTISVTPGNNLGMGGWCAYNNPYNHPSSTPPHAEDASVHQDTQKHSVLLNSDVGLFPLKNNPHCTFVLQPFSSVFRLSKINPHRVFINCCVMFAVGCSEIIDIIC